MFKVSYLIVCYMFFSVCFLFRELEQMYDDERKVKKEVMAKLDQYVSLIVFVSRIIAVSRICWECFCSHSGARREVFPL